MKNTRTIAVEDVLFLVIGLPEEEVALEEANCVVLDDGRVSQLAVPDHRYKLGIRVDHFFVESHPPLGVHVDDDRIERIEEVVLEIDDVCSEVDGLFDVGDGVTVDVHARHDHQDGHQVLQPVFREDISVAGRSNSHDDVVHHVSVCQANVRVVLIHDRDFI